MLKSLQPELRALMMFDTLPEGCIAHLVANADFMPHIRPGEFVVVDTHDTEPRNGEIYVIQWQSGRRALCQAFEYVTRALNFPPETKFWSVRGMAKNIAIPGHAKTTWADGPYADVKHLQEKLVGAIIGIYQPNFEEPRRIVSCV